MNEAISMTVYYEFSLLLLISAALGTVAVKLRQPLIVAFILVGILAGPAVFDWVSAEKEIHLLAEIGVTMLLFVVGLKLDMHLVRNLGPVALATGLGQLVFTIIFGYLIGIGLGMDWVHALYVAIALTFSSTIIIVKLLSDKREIDSLHGRIAMGFLIVQDVAVVIAMMVVGSLSVADMDAGGAGALLVTVVSKLIAAGVFVAVMMNFVLPRLMELLARSQELLLIFAIAWGTSMATLGEVAGFSKEVGGFLAGFSLASTQYREAISSRLGSIRDFLLLFFFVNLGSQLEFGALGEELIAALIFAVFVLIGNPVIVMAIMGFMGYRRRTGFLAGLTVAQISEFSIIFVAMGMSMGHIHDNTLGLITLVGLVTITISTYMILNSEFLYQHLSPWLGIFERANTYRETDATDDEVPGTEIIVFGLGRYGGRLAEQLHQRGLRVLGIDFDPEVVRAARQTSMPVKFGDMGNSDFIDHLDFDEVRWVVSAVPELEANLHLAQALRQVRFRGNLAATAHTERDALKLKEAGVQRVLRPYLDAADFAAECIAE
ncbi:MAG: cation:proton antiporter family protein [Pseudomonadales bacterium]